MKPAPFAYHAPKTIEETVTVLAEVAPEDGRVLAGAISFKNPSDLLDGLAFTGMTNQPEPDRIDAVADRIAALARLQATPRGKRRIAMLLLRAARTDLACRTRLVFGGVPVRTPLVGSAE